MVIRFQDLPQIRKKHKDQKIVFAGGTFDLIHPGHIEFLRNLKKFGEIVVVAVSNNESVAQRKGPSRPILDEKERLEVIDSIKYVDYVFISPKYYPSKDRPTVQIVRKLLPDVFVSIDLRWNDYKSKIEEYGVKVKLLKVEKLNSTTNLINKIIRNYLTESQNESYPS